jgi:peptide/nickel transport system ATP-binding protein
VAALLEVDGLQTHFFTRDGIVRAVDGVSFSVAPGETLAVVGESGCGKSVTSLSILRLIASPPGRIVAGRVIFEGRDLLALTEDEMRAVRGDAISMIFQEPMTSLNPALTVGRQIAESLVLHRGLSQHGAMAKAVEMLRKVHMPEPERRVRQYPHELSGGMRQRVMIAMALACGPRLLIADEPTTALDVTIQAQILELMRELARETGAAIILITHDLGVVAEMAQRVVVMYAGRKVEEAPVEELFARPRHPYSRGLLGSMPHLGDSVRGEGGKKCHRCPPTVRAIGRPAGIQSNDSPRRCAARSSAVAQVFPGEDGIARTRREGARGRRRELLGARRRNARAGR